MQNTVLKLEQCYPSSLSFNDLNFFESYKKPKVLSCTFKCSNLFYNDMIIISTTTKKYSHLKNSLSDCISSL